jgi:hypothetical protein
MSKFILFLLLVVAAIVMVPAARERVRPKLQPALDPVYAWSTRNRISALVELVREQEMLGQPIPKPAEFSRFVENRDVTRDGSVDAWGTPFYLHVTRRGLYTVGSAGKDRIVGTGDDITGTGQARNPPARRR